jgi:hypothetical protein
MSRLTASSFREPGALGFGESRAFDLPGAGPGGLEPEEEC